MNDMRKGILIFMIIFLCAGSLFGSGFGLRNELSFFKTGKTTYSSLINLNIGFKADIAAALQLKMFGGYNYFSEDYNGLSASAYLEREVFQNFKVIVGLNLLSNTGAAHGVGIYTETYSKSFFHYIIGCGINISSRTALDLLYYIPDVNEYGYEEYGYGISGWIRTPMEHYHTIKIGFEYYFYLFDRE